MRKEYIQKLNYEKAELTFINNQNIMNFYIIFKFTYSDGNYRQLTKLN